MTQLQFGDVRFRTEISLYQGLFINFLYIGIKQFSGIYYRSVWFISLAAYYVLLAVMRFILLRGGKKETAKPPMETELTRYRACGIMLLLMNQALGGDDEAFRAVMTGATGGGVCTIVIAMAVFMIWKSTRQIKKLHLVGTN